MAAGERQERDCRRWRVRRGRACATLLALGLASAMILPASVSATSADAVATEAYLTAVYTYEQAVVANISKSLGAVEALSSRLAGECPGVLHGAPPPTPSTPRGFGEFAREHRQLRDLQEELDSAAGAAYAVPDREAATALANSVSSLQWSNATLTSLVHAEVTAEQERLEMPALEVCADMRAWVSSGYRTLSTATAAFLKAREASRRTEPGAPTVEQLLAPYESAHDKALIRETRAVGEREDTNSIKTLLRAFDRLRQVVGLHVFPIETSKPKPATVIARLNTAAGEKLVAKLEPPEPGRHGCKVGVSIESTKRQAGTLVFSAGGSADVCLSSRYSGPAPSVNCNEGRLTITAHTLPSAHSVRLLLSDGRQITSPTIRAPRRGGREGYYYQVLRGPSPIPVSLTVLDANGSTLDVVRLPAIVECTRHPLKYLPGGREHKLVHGQAPQGPSFAIVAEHYRFLGRVYFQLKIQVTPEGSGGEIGGSSSSGLIGGRAHTFSLEESTGCRPHLYDIVYGLLKPPGATVLVRVAGVLTPLQEVAIPAQLHAGGALVYGAFSTPPTEVVVRDAHGRTLSSESLAESAKATTEQCEGEAEPGGTAETGGGEGARVIHVSG
jgi:hypothetical protein